jgi:prepilin signal peptidase PulO-like enzyme (type II secretory pathway)
MALWWSFPGSHCPRCQHALSWFENVPVLGWLALRGRCRHCGTSIPARYFWWECAWAAFGSGLAWWAEWKGIAVFWVVLAILVLVEGVWRVLDKRKVLDGT